jgi:hypothetical protein
MSGVSVEPASPHDLAAMEALLTANQLPTAGLRTPFEPRWSPGSAAARSGRSLSKSIRQAYCCDRWPWTVRGAAAASAIN